MLAVLTEEEIKEVVWSCEGSKSPRPNGLTSISLRITGRFSSVMF